MKKTVATRKNVTRHEGFGPLDSSPSVPSMACWLRSRLPWLELDAAQTKRVADDRNRAEAHGGRREHGIEQEAERGIENAGGDGNPERVVHEGEEQVLLDVAHRRPAQP